MRHAVKWSRAAQFQLKIQFTGLILAKWPCESNRRNQETRGYPEHSGFHEVVGCPPVIVELNSFISLLINVLRCYKTSYFHFFFITIRILFLWVRQTHPGALFATH